LDEKITFTRSRPYKKKDQAHVEQKSWSVVHHVVGYDRLESSEQYALLEDIYADLRLYVNFSQPVLKLISKKLIVNKVICKYDIAKTPYQRVMENEKRFLWQEKHTCSICIYTSILLNYVAVLMRRFSNSGVLYQNE